MKRRDFIKYGTGGLAALVLGNIPGIMNNPAYAAKKVKEHGRHGIINLTITDAIKHMVTDQTLIAAAYGSGLPPIPLAGNNAQCYMWIFKDPALPPDCPGPIIFGSTGYTLTVNVTNMLDDFHQWSVPRLGITTGPIAPKGGTASVTFKLGPAGTYLYYDDLNEPVNRMMGLHGAFIVMPAKAVGAHRFTPFDNPPPNIQQLFDDLGGAPWWPGLAWEEGDPATDTPPFRQNVWVLHQASPKLFKAVGNNATIIFKTTTGESVTGNARDPVVFTKAFLHDQFNPIHDPTQYPDGANFIPQFFTISGQAGHFAHNNPWICPYSRVGEPYLIRILNAGMWLHSTHIHANHVFVLSHNNGFDPVPGVVDNPIWVDVYTANPLDTYEWLIPYMRPPDVPNDLGIGRDDLEKSIDVSSFAMDLGGFGIAPGGPPYKAADIPASAAKLTWPPGQEMQMFIPTVGSRMALAQDGKTKIDCAVRLSPVCFPMHDHSEPSQVAQGGNYNCGLISGIVFCGDRKGARPGGAGVITFPDRPYTDDPMTPVAHGPEMLPGQDGDLWPSCEFQVPSIP